MRFSDLLKIYVRLFTLLHNLFSTLSMFRVQKDLRPGGRGTILSIWWLIGSNPFSRANAIRITVSNALPILISSPADVSKYGTFEFSKREETAKSTFLKWKFSVYTWAPNLCFILLNLSTIEINFITDNLNINILILKIS